MLSLLEMSFSGAVLIVVVIVLRALSVNRLPKKAFLLLWAAALLRLTLPFDIPSPVSVYSILGRKILSQSPVRLPSAHLGLAASGGRELMTVGGRLADSIHDAAGPVSLPGGMAAENPSVFLLIWLAGFLILALAFLITHLRGRQSYLVSLPVENAFVKGWLEAHRLRRPVQARYSDRIGAPLTYGVLWPVILLPKNMDWKEEEALGYILAHEFSHIRRFDALTKWILAAVLCLHWFNPFVWVMYVLAGRDLELSCDEAVLRQYGLHSRCAYALTLVSMEEKRAYPAPLASGFSKNALKERITAIMKSKPLTLGNSLAALVLIVTVVVLFTTSAMNGAKKMTVTQDGKLTADSSGGQNTLSGSGSAGDEEEVSYFDKMKGTGVWSEEAFDDYDDDQWEKEEQSEERAYTQDEYDRLLEALAISNYENMPIAEFNRKVHAVFYDVDNNENDLLYIYEEVLSEMSADDPNEGFLRGTVLSSLREYEARVDEVYSKTRVDPECSGYAESARGEEVYGDFIATVTTQTKYSFCYRILDQDRLTVGERDAFLENILLDAQEILDQKIERKEGAVTEQEFRSALLEGGAERSNEKIEFTDCQIQYLETY